LTASSYQLQDCFSLSDPGQEVDFGLLYPSPESTIAHSFQTPLSQQNLWPQNYVPTTDDVTIWSQVDGILYPDFPHDFLPAPFNPPGTFHLDQSSNQSNFQTAALSSTTYSPEQTVVSSKAMLALG